VRKAPHGRWPCRIGGALLLLVLPQLALAINCQVRLTPINFGTYIPLTTAPVDVNASITIRCMAQPGTYAVTIGSGLSGDQLARTLSAGGTNVLYYNLYRDAARMQIWGDGAPPTFTVIGTRPGKGRPTETDHPIYGRIFAGQAPDPGSYTDNLVVTVMF
jgi:spore coat protein U-like protein